MKVIFLDFDGVINDIRKKDVLVVSEFVLNLKKIVEQTNAKIVVTSSRKNEFIGVQNIKHEDTICYKYFEIPLKNMGIEIYDYTSFLGADKNIEKEMEIELYLKEHSEIKDFVILDDDIIMHKFLEHQVFIEYSNGLLSEHVNPAIRILNGQLCFYPPNYDISETLQERVLRIYGFNLFDNDSFADEIEKKLSRILYINKKNN